MKQLTENCPDFGAIYRCKELQDGVITQPQLRRKLLNYRFSSNQANQAITQSDQYEVQEGLLYRYEYDPVWESVKLVWCVPSGSAKSTRILGGRHPVSVRSEILAWFHLSDTHGLHSSLDATLGKILGRYYWPTVVSDTEGFISKCNTRF